MPQDEIPFDSRPRFVIPYWSSTDPTKADDGDIRPVPTSKAVWYLCESIHASPYQAGQQLDVKVDIANYGGANTPSIAQVTVWSGGLTRLQDSFLDPTSSSATAQWKCHPAESVISRQ